MELPSMLTDTFTDAELDQLADEAEAQHRADAFLARLEQEREASGVFVI